MPKDYQVTENRNLFLLTKEKSKLLRIVKQNLYQIASFSKDFGMIINFF